jgi:adenine phosphoribosyltransferase|tara:strand:- start:715 stop:1242 length:528 start_codon:yes stop_codon:yes gene_type:complete
MKASIRTVYDFPIPGIQYRDITGLLEDPKSFKEAIIDMTSKAMQFKVQTIIGIESRGFVFGAPIAFDLDLPFVLARKPGKLPNKTVSKKYTLEYGEAELHLQELSPILGNVVIIDDLIATGGTALACADLIHENWRIPKENILILAVIDLPDLKGSKTIKEHGYKVKTLIEYKGE